MAKFNMEKLKGLDLKEDNEQGKFKVGAGLLNDVSKSQNKETKISYLNRSDIEKNEKNEYTINDIEGLMWSIRQMGLIQPLHVMPLPNGNYRLLGGERRLTAIDKLIANPEVEKWNEDTLIPCVVKDPKEIDLPLSDELKETFAIITTNKEARKYTDADRLMEIREWKRIIAALRENGVESIPYSDEEGEDKEIIIKGVVTRDILTQTTGLSRGTINKYEKVDQKGSKALKNAIFEGRTTIHTANEMVDQLQEEEQEDLIKESEEQGTTITPQHVRKKVEERVEPNAVTLAKFEKDLKEISKSLKKKKVCLNDEEQMRYNNCIDELKQLLCEE